MSRTPGDRVGASGTPAGGVPINLEPPAAGFAMGTARAPLPFHKMLKVVALIDRADPQTRQLLDQIAAESFEIDVSDRYDRDVDADADVGAYIMTLDGVHVDDARRLARAVRAIGYRTPLWALADAHRMADVAALAETGEIDGYIYLGQQTPGFYAKQVVASIVAYGKSLLPPFFGGLVAYDADATVTFASPGHQGGQFYRHSPAGQLFLKHFGAGVFRNDLCNVDGELGDPSKHEGLAAQAERCAARVFGADRTYFVLNGTSTSNKIVTSALLRRGDLVLFDRNNHKSLHEGALVQAGAIPVYLPAARNAFGMIGAVDWDAWDEDYLRGQIRRNPLVTNSARADAERPFRLACIQLATYDGTVYNARQVLDRIARLCEYVLWDEAWIGHNAFHPLFENHSPMRLRALGPEMPGLFSTQSAQKQGAGFSQASQIHKRDDHLQGQRRYVEHRRFNEALLMHASTSPFYPLFASLDVNAKVHEGRAGEMLWDRCIRLGIDLRKKLREFGDFYARTGATALEQWFFDPFVPDVVTIRGSRVTEDVARVPWEALATDVLAREQQCWRLQPLAAWHGYVGYASDYAMVDPTKLTLLTPGIDRHTGAYLDFGVPATVVAHYLREQRVLPEKCALNSLLFLLTPAEDESKLNTLIAKLVRFKNLWDRDAPIADLLPALCAKHYARYAGYTLRLLCDELHAFYRAVDLKELQRLCFRASSFPEQAMLAQEAHRALVANDVDYVPLDAIEGRVAATLASIDPPGSAVVVPGERWDERARPMRDYLQALEESFNRFPGFNVGIQGVYPERIGGRTRFYTYVVRETAAAAP